MSEHRDAREALELAAVVVAHLAGCPACLEEMARLRRADALLRPILFSAPDPALRERTLAFVRATGVPRSASRSASRVPASRVPAGRRRAPFGWAAALAAALVVGLLGGALIVRVATPDGNADPAVAFDQVTPGMGGTLILSPSAGRMVVSATGLGTPPRGSEYRCWVEVNGTRVALGAMWWAGDVAWWAGDVAIPAVIPPGVVYGVSLVEEGAPGPGTVVLTGSL
jgi:hypothetical protein